MLGMLDFVFDFIANAITDFVGGVFGRRFQRRRARRLQADGRLPCAFRDGKKWRRGTAELCNRRIRFKDNELHVETIELPGVTQPAGGSERGQILWFDPEVRILRVITSDGPREWAILEWQTPWAIERLGLPSA
ncbi:hypothetical protein EFY87_18840 [Flexivirga caeni]|uniref:Uncharacterized protein n=2 Tax=Flexivirga caeni TaxID=2294115 RepID=A0A3M9LXJ8_9MICO|nr:hypothetical protein EFY87_18840 [Flexivirga caeni]